MGGGTKQLSLSMPQAQLSMQLAPLSLSMMAELSMGFVDTQREMQYTTSQSVSEDTFPQEDVPQEVPGSEKVDGLAAPASLALAVGIVVVAVASVLLSKSLHPTAYTAVPLLPSNDSIA